MIKNDMFYFFSLYLFQLIHILLFSKNCCFINLTSMIAHTYTCLVTTDIQVSKHQGLYKLIIAQQQSNRHQSTKILTHTTMQILSYKERLLAFLAHYYFIFFFKPLSLCMTLHFFAQLVLTICR